MFFATLLALAAGLGYADRASGQPVWMQQSVTAQAPVPTSAPVVTTAVGAFGAAVVVEGDTAFVGAPFTAFGGNVQQGAVYVFSENADHVWEQAAVLMASDGGAYDQFGSEIALSGPDLIVGAPGATVNGNLAQGAAYVFSLDGGIWTQAQKLTASDGAAGDEFGGAVAMDASLVLVGARHAAVGGNTQQGAVYAFAFAGGNWSEVQKLLSADGASDDLFGTAIALHGTTALIGAPGATVGGAPLRGAVYAFDYAAGTWSQSQKLLAGDGIAGDLFGSAVAMHGTAALIGAPQAAVSGKVNQGKVYSYLKTGSTWSSTGTLVAEEGGANDQFGTAIALAGSQSLIGTQSNSGYSYLFERQGGVWTQTIRFEDGLNAGRAVAFQNRLAAVGKPSNAGGEVAFHLKGNLSLSINAPSEVHPKDNVSVNIILTNNAATSTPPLQMITFAPVETTHPSVVATQGDCDLSVAILCSFGVVAGNGGTAQVHVEYQVTKAAAATTLIETATVLNVAPALQVSAEIRVADLPHDDGGGSLALGLLAALALLASGAALRRRRRGT